VLRMNTWWKRLAIISMFAAGAAFAQTGGSTSGGPPDDGSTPAPAGAPQRLSMGTWLDAELGWHQLGLDGLRHRLRWRRRRWNEVQEAREELPVELQRRVRHGAPASSRRTQSRVRPGPSPRDRARRARCRVLAWPLAKVHRQRTSAASRRAVEIEERSRDVLSPGPLVPSPPSSPVRASRPAALVVLPSWCWPACGSGARPGSPRSASWWCWCTRPGTRSPPSSSAGRWSGSSWGRTSRDSASPRCPPAGSPDRRVFGRVRRERHLRSAAAGARLPLPSPPARPLRDGACG
jgi:hypothetical protein